MPISTHKAYSYILHIIPIRHGLQAVLVGILFGLGLSCHGQHFTLHKEHDSLYWLGVSIKDGSASYPAVRNRTGQWRLPYPVYQFQTGDVNGDGSIDAIVGVVKSTRFYPERGRRLFIFKQVNGKVRPLWLGSRLGGILQDFRFTDGRLRSLEMTADSLYVVAEYQWSGFGLAFDHYIIQGTDQETAIKYLNNYIYEDKKHSHGLCGASANSLQPQDK